MSINCGNRLISIPVHATAVFLFLLGTVVAHVKISLVTEILVSFFGGHNFTFKLTGL